MKKKLLGLLAGCLILAASFTKADAQISVNLNVGLWNPPAEYSTVEYYYLPDVESYYYVPKHQYVYMDGGNWVFRNSLPTRYSNYNINNGYKVAVNRPRAYTYYTTDRVRYAKYKGYDKPMVVRGNSYAAHDKNYARRTTVVRTYDGGPGNGHGNGGEGRGNGGDKGHGGGHGNGNGGGHGNGGDKGHGGGHGNH